MASDGIGDAANIQEERQELIESLNEISDNLLSAYHEFIDTKPSLLMRLICEGILGIHNEDYQDNPFLNDEEVKVVRRHYSDMAAMILYRLDKGHSTTVIGEYVSLKNWINDHAGQPHFPPKRKFESPETGHMAWGLMLGLEEYFGSALHYAYELIYHGVPIYTLDDELGEYGMIPFTDDDYVFMSRLGRHSMDIRTGIYPEWIKRYSFKGSDLAAHDLFFRGDLPDDSGIDALRCAYHRHLFPDGLSDKVCLDGDPAVTINSKTHESLLRAIADFPSRYPESRNKPPKLDADVRPWLKSGGYASSDREAHVFGSIISEQFKLSSDT